MSPSPPAPQPRPPSRFALRESRLSRVTLARRLGVDEKAVRRMLDPRHRTAVHRIEAALRMLGQELVIETRAA